MKWLTIQIGIRILMVFCPVCVAMSLALFTKAQEEETPVVTSHTSITPDSAGMPDSSSVEPSFRKVDADTMVLVPAGRFTMGSDQYEDEKPPHTVYLDSFYIDKYEVTNSQYGKFLEAMKKAAEADTVKKPTEKATPDVDAAKKPPKRAMGEGGKRPNGMPFKMKGDEPPRASHEPVFWSDSTLNKPEYPVLGVSWVDAQAYCEWAGKRLPTEAEWEKTARGVDGRMYPWGDVPPDEGETYRTNYDPGKDIHGEKRIDGFDQTAPIGSFPEDISPYGVYDMAGNVSEWVADRWGSRYYAVSPDSTPSGPLEGAYRIVRGGSWDAFGYYIRATTRAWADSTNKVKHIGFRCVRCAEESAERPETPGRPAGQPGSSAMEER